VRMVRHSLRLASLTFLTGIAAPRAESQERERPFYYPAPAAGTVEETRGVRFATADTLPLSFDLYHPAQSSGPAPALIFYSLFWPEDGNARRSDEWGTWARVAAGNGIVERGARKSTLVSLGIVGLWRLWD
jgi:hypothetical protein